MFIKQGVLKEEKIKFAIFMICSLIPFFAVTLLILLNDDGVEDLLTFILMYFIPLFLPMLFYGLKNLEWYHIYEDKIEVLCLFGKKNSVEYTNVKFVEEVKINLTSRSMEKSFFIFNDGRKNNNNILDINSCYNNKKFNLRIYKTCELENFIINNPELILTIKD